MNEEEIIKVILDEAFYIHKTIDPGMLENVYKTCLAYRLRQRRLFVETEKPVPVIFEEVRMDCGYRADLVVERRVIADTKTIDALNRVIEFGIYGCCNHLHATVAFLPVICMNPKWRNNDNKETYYF